MSGLGYQLGKLLGTAVVTLSRLSKGVYIATALLSLLLILFLYGAIGTNKLSSSSSRHYLQVGKSARITNSAQQVNMRRTSGYQNKPRSDVITTVPAGEMVEIVGGPEQSDDLIWWLVRWDAYQGWIAQHTVSQRLLLEPT